jgi:polyphosphate kinase
MVNSRSVSKNKRTRKRTVPDFPSPLSHPGDVFNRELSWLEFNRRVLAQAQNADLPLLERVKFLSIFTSNLDEFYGNRIGGLKKRLDSWGLASSAGVSVGQQLDTIRSKIVEIVRLHEQTYQQNILPELAQNGISLLTWSQLSELEQASARQYFSANIFPILTPLAVDPGHPFPFISNLSLSLGMILKHPERGEELFARVKIPTGLPQLIRLETGEYPDHFRLISISQVIQHNMEALFPGMVVHSVMPFRITRNSEIDVDDLDTDDIVQLIEEELRERKFATIIRLEHGPNSDPAILKFLMQEIELTDSDVYESQAALDAPLLKEICELNLPHLKIDPWMPVSGSSLGDDDANIFSVIRNSDVLVHHPYESFGTSVERFLASAANDPRVLAIKMTLYRAGDSSTLVPLLIRAAENEKQVVCLIEVKASLDEARNIKLAQTLEDAGVHVVYGVVGLKTHAKAILVVRREADGVCCYAHIGSGNYNATTARTYTDVGLFTANKGICDDLVELFHFLTGRSLKRDYKHLLVAPTSLKERLLGLIEREIACHKRGLPARIIIKANGLEDVACCKALRQAAEAGVAVDLIIRGICCLKPLTVQGRIVPRVISVVGRFLEHSRIFYFRNGSEDYLDGEMYISSADLMVRNLHRRVEVAVPLYDRSTRERCWEILTAMIHDHGAAWELQTDGSYVLATGKGRSDRLNSQELLMQLAKERDKLRVSFNHPTRVSVGDEG